MASLIHPARRAQNPRRGRFLGFAVMATVSCGVLAGGAFALATTLGAMHGATKAVSEARISFAVPLHRRQETSVESPRERMVKVAKFSRLAKPSESEIEERERILAAIERDQKRKVAVQLALAEAKAKPATHDNTQTAGIRAALVLAHADQQEKTTGTPSLVTALLEDLPPRESAPFGLVLAQPDEDVGEEADDLLALPGEIPLPEFRPEIETEASGQKPAEQPRKKDLAVQKPDRSLFDSLFKRKSSEGGWPGKGTRVAIYDVSNATVYMPDGTTLRAHSGIGAMRDNPRYEHVKMKGPTPAGIYRLSMREKRFYGVEAIRMTSIDGRDPKNRTGLLTHTNLLRGQIGSHGCVAFRNYEPFLKAFKRGQVKTLMVVPELPSSRTQIAALYRKAGA